MPHNGQCFLFLGTLFILSLYAVHVDASLTKIITFPFNVLEYFITLPFRIIEYIISAPGHILRYLSSIPHNLWGYFVNFISNLVFQEKCYEHLGCFTNGPPFFDFFNRPISLLPDDHLKTMFLLFTPSTWNDSYVLYLNNASVLNSTYDAKIPTKVLVPGFLVNLAPDDTLFKIKDELLKYGKFNVIIIDWSKSNNFPYARAVANGRVVGAQVAYLLKLIKKNKGISYKKVHLIGHSLGAHICGWTGERINKIGRISGLDPAGPYFQNAPVRVRLDTTDAEFVDIIHTDGGFKLKHGLGLKEQIGNEDFYPNGGSQQPACRHNRTFLLHYFGFTAAQCDHSISMSYFLSSIKKCQYIGLQCESYEEFQNRKCTRSNATVAVMGFHAKKKDIKGSHKFYLHVSPDSPFCSYNDSSIGS